MKKFFGIVCIFVVCLMSASITALTERPETDTGKQSQRVTICIKGKTITLSEEDVETFLKLGATRGACAEETATSPQPSEQTQKKARQQDTQSGQSQKAGETDKTGSQGQGQKKVTICHKGKVTITISEAALPAHLKHGDTLGACSGTAQQPQSNTGQSVIIPNNTGGTSQNQTTLPASGNKGTGKNQGKRSNSGKKGDKKGGGKKSR